MPLVRNSCNNPIQEVHIAVLGMNQSGKSALTVKYITRRFITEYDPNLEDNYCKHEAILGREYMIWIMDTVEQRGADPMRYLAWADIYLVVYDITSQLSLQYAETLLRLIGQHEHSLCIRQHVTFLVGNKNDLERYRQVSQTDGQHLAERYSAQFTEITTTEQYAIVKSLFHKAITLSLSERLRSTVVVDRSPSPRLYSSDSEVVGVTNRSKTAFTPPLLIKSSTSRTGFRRSKSPKQRETTLLKQQHHQQQHQHQLPPGATTAKTKSGPGSKLLKLFQQN